jgi:hypothetical protein
MALLLHWMFAAVDNGQRFSHTHWASANMYTFTFVFFFWYSKPIGSVPAIHFKPLPDGMLIDVFTGLECAGMVTRLLHRGYDLLRPQAG